MHTPSPLHIDDGVGSVVASSKKVLLHQGAFEFMEIHINLCIIQTYVSYSIPDCLSPYVRVYLVFCIYVYMRVCASVCVCV